jgi:hypothetical protein
MMLEKLIVYLECEWRLRQQEKTYDFLFYGKDKGKAR